MKIKNSIILSFALLSVSLPSMAADLNGDEKGKASYQQVHPVSAQTSKEIDLPLGYRFKRWIWTNLQFFTVAYLSEEGKMLPLPADKGSGIVSWREHDSRIPFDNIFTAKTVPSEEKSFAMSLAAKAVYFLLGNFPPTSSGLPQIPEGNQEIAKLFPSQYQRFLPLSSISRELADKSYLEDRIAPLVLAGPLASHVQRETINKEDFFTIDLSFYERFSVKERLAPLGAKAILRYNSERKRLETREIQKGGLTHKREETSFKDWQHLENIFLATMVTDAKFHEHLLKLHMYTAGPFCAVNNLYLNKNHPLRLLMYPHQRRTLLGNNNNIVTLLGDETSFFCSILSYSRSTLIAIANQKTLDFQLSCMDVEKDFKQRDMTDLKDETGQAISYPYKENVSRFWKIIDDHTNAYLNYFYPDNSVLENDPEVLDWYSTLNKSIPNGLPLEGIVSRANVQNLINIFIYTASVRHELMGYMDAKYFSWQNLIPTQVPSDPSKRATVDILHRSLDLSLLANIPSVKMTDDFSHLTSDGNIKIIFRNFRQNLLDYQKELIVKGDVSDYTLLPFALQSSASA